MYTATNFVDQLSAGTGFVWVQTFHWRPKRTCVEASGQVQQVGTISAQTDRSHVPQPTVPVSARCGEYLCFVYITTWWRHALLRYVVHTRQTDPGPPHYDPSNPNHSKPLTQAQKSPPFLSSATRNDKMSTKFFTGNHVSAKMQFTVNVLYKVYSVFALSYFSRRTRWVRVDMMCRSLRRENTETATLIISNRKPDVSIQPKTSNSCTHSFYWVRSMWRHTTCVFCF